MKSKKWIGAFAALAVSACIIIPCAVSVSAKTEKHTDNGAKGVFIGDIDINGMTSGEVKKAVKDYIKTYTDKKINLSMDGKTIEVSVGDLGYYWSDTEVVEEAMEYGNIGNAIERYKERKDIDKDNVKFDIDVDIDTDTMKKAINDNCSQFNVAHVNAGITRKGEGFAISASSTGRKIAVKKSVEELKDFLLEKWDGQNADFDLVVVDDKPVSTEEDCKLVKDVLGTFSTSFSTNGNYNRNMNMKNGMEHINGTVVYPGETFSANALLEPWTADNGWYEAGTYVNGKVENSLGGGICQVSTTLYNAVLLSELEVVERHPHSMNVDYVDLAADAALAGTWKDLKFANNTDVPVYIEGVYDDSGKLTFTLYGKETRDPGRSVVYVSETLSTNYPEEVVTNDPSKPAGYRMVTVRGHVGYTAKLWKEVYQNDKLVDRTLVNTSTYQSTPIYVIYGTGEAEAAPTEPATKKEEATTKKNTEKKTTQAETKAPSNEETTEAAR